VDSLHRHLNCEIIGLDCRAIITEYRARVIIVYTCNIYFVGTLVNVVYSGVYGQCSHTMYVFYTDSTSVITIS